MALSMHLVQTGGPAGGYLGDRVGDLAKAEYTIKGRLP